MSFTSTCSSCVRAGGRQEFIGMTTPPSASLTCRKRHTLGHLVRILAWRYNRWRNQLRRITANRDRTTDRAKNAPSNQMLVQAKRTVIDARENNDNDGPKTEITHTTPCISLHGL